MIGTEFKFYLICMDRHFICIYKYLNLHTTEKGGEREEERMQERERERESWYIVGNSFEKLYQPVLDN